MYNKIEMITETKNGKAWETAYTYTDAATVYERLAQDLIAKKINKCSWILKVMRTQLYNGFEKIVVTYNNKCRNTYIIESH